MADRPWEECWSEEGAVQCLRRRCATMDCPGHVHARPEFTSGASEHCDVCVPLLEGTV